MHIPDNYLSPQTCAVLTAAVIPAWVVSVRRIKQEMPKEKIPLLGVGAAFSFLGMMFNIPLPGGTTGHAVGGTLIASLVGPYGACISITVALLLQALLFGDGGILSFGANCFNMAFVLPFVGYAVSRFVASHVKGRNKDLIGVAVGSYAGINAAALCAAIEFGIQPLLFTDASGNPMYCPYGLAVSIPAMMIGHLTLFGLAEVVYTAAVYAFLQKASPFMLEEAGADTGERKKSQVGVNILLGALIVLTPLGLLAEGTAWGEWSAEEIAGTGAGLTPSGMLNGFSFASLLPDYTFGGLPDVLGYVLCALIGTAVLIIVFKVVSVFGKSSGPSRA